MKKSLRHLLLLASLWLGLPGAAHPADHITQRSWFEDKTGQLSLAQVSAEQFRPFESVLSQGVGKGTIWVKLRIDPEISKGLGDQSNQKYLYLKISPVYLDHVELFDPLDIGPKARRTGDRYPVVDDEFRSLTLSFLIPRTESARDIYLKVDTTSTRFFHAEALTVEDLLESERRLQIFSGIFTGISILLLAWGLVSWVISREALLFAYVLSQSAGLIFGVAVLGHVRYVLGHVLGPTVVDLVTSFSVIAAVGFATYFYWRLFLEFKPTRWASLSLQIVMGLSVLAFVLVLVGEVRAAVMLNWSLLSLVSPLCFVIVFFCKGWAQEESKARRLLPRPVLGFYFGSVFLLTFVAALGGLGLFESGRLAIYSGLGNSLLSGILAFAILQYRAALNQKAQAQIAAELASAKEIAEKEREHRLDQDRLLTMLAHELKTPLSVISLAFGTQTQPEASRSAAKTAVRDMRNIIDQCLEADMLSATRLRIRTQPVKLQEVFAESLARIPGLQQRLKIEGPADIVIETDPMLLRIILFNLLDNADRYSDAADPVCVEIVQGESGSVSITVANGLGAAGFPDAERIFEKYYRSAGAHRSSGTGLGLYLSRQLAEKLGGSLRYAVQGSQISFTLCLP